VISPDSVKNKYTAKKVNRHDCISVLLKKNYFTIHGVAVMRQSRFYSLSVILTVVLLVMSSGCASVFRTHPVGEKIGSCEGRMRLSSGKRVPFRFDLFTYEDDTRLYFSIPGKYHYRPVEDIDFEDGRIGIELRSPHRILVGELTGTNLKFSGMFPGFSGSFKIDLDE
jgi:hypothetical protein